MGSKKKAPTSAVLDMDEMRDGMPAVCVTIPRSAVLSSLASLRLRTNLRLVYLSRSVPLGLRLQVTPCYCFTVYPGEYVGMT